MCFAFFPAVAQVAIAAIMPMVETVNPVCLSMCYQKYNCTQKDDATDDKRTLISDSAVRRRHFFDFFFRQIVGAQSFPEAHVKEYNHQYQTGYCNDTGIE